MAESVIVNHIYRRDAGDGWTYLLAQDHPHRTGGVILGVLEGRSPASGYTHLYLREVDGHLADIFGADFPASLTIDDLIDTGITWQSIEPRAGYREWQRYLSDYRPSRPLHFGCDHQDAPCVVTGSEHHPCLPEWRYLCSQCRTTEAQS